MTLNVNQQCIWEPLFKDSDRKSGKNFVAKPIDACLEKSLHIFEAM